MSFLFEWDPSKERLNLLKHQVSFEEAATVFSDFFSITIGDPIHSHGYEQRFVTIGLSFRDRMLVVIHCDRGESIRIISARLAQRKERKIYEEENQY